MLRTLTYMLTSMLLLGGCARGGGIDAGWGEVTPTTFDGGPPPRTDAAIPPRTDAAVPPRTDAAIPRVDAAVPLTDAGPPCAGVVCSSLDGPCQIGVCDGATGSCVATPLTDGSACDDGVACTESVCSGGSCVGTPLDCSSLNGTCATGTCDMTTGGCIAAPVMDGTSCDTDFADCAAPTCQAGVCAMANSPDCSACSVAGGSICARGTCSTSAETLTYDFESGLPPGWTVGGDTGWAVGSTRAHGGTLAAQSGSITHDEISSMFASFSFTVPVEISMWVYTSTESCCDRLLVFVDGVEQGRWAGTTAWTQVSVFLSPGAHAVEWRYDKDGSVSSGDDRVFVDDIQIQIAPPVERFEAAGLPTGYTTSGDANWSVTSRQAHGGTMSAESGDIGSSETTSLFFTANYAAAGTLSFWRRVSTESSFDYLEFYIDGARQDRWAGSLTTWTQESYPVGAGAHMLEWRYLKDSSVSSGDDTVWIDDVTATDAVMTANLCGP